MRGQTTHGELEKPSLYPFPNLQSNPIQFSPKLLGFIFLFTLPISQSPKQSQNRRVSCFFSLCSILNSISQSQSNFHVSFHFPHFFSLCPIPNSISQSPKQSHSNLPKSQGFIFLFTLKT